MGKPPAVVIVARHGARLDAADSQWHLTSPTPYDPPLTYGGWRQSQALGARIASILDVRESTEGSHIIGGSRDSDDETKRDGRNDHRTPKGKRRRHKVVIHTSPFLRCIQTSIAISAGMAQYQRTSKPSSHQTHPKPHVMHSGSPHVHAMDNRNSPRLSAIPEPGVTAKSRRSITPKGFRRTEPTLLRVDAFLGEWLSPDYFDKITPPPGSKMMLAGAKGDLLRGGDPVDMVPTSSRNASGNFPGGWGSGGLNTNGIYNSDEDSPLDDLSSIGKNLPRISRANSHHIGSPSARSRLDVASRVESSRPQEPSAYVAPTPSYAVSPSQPIPQGYVAHARDACVKIDFQWDSMKPPLEWGNGGDYGEEWSSMHKRFRRGLHDMIAWYRNHDSSATLQAMSDEIREGRSLEVHDDEDVDTVLVLVTHGAGCNALIGALTNQPVLIDVGMASLTMAVQKSVDYRRVASPTNTSASPPRRRQSIVDYGDSGDYEVKLVASTEHLRAGSQFLTTGTELQRAPSLPVRNKSTYRYERPGLASKHPATSGLKRSALYDEAATNNDEVYSSRENSTSTNIGFGGLQKNTTAATSGGLWSMPVAKKEDNTTEKDKKPPSPQASRNGPVKIPILDGAFDEPGSEKLSNGTLEGMSGRSTPGRDDQGRSIVRTGLWGAPPQALATERDKGAKRRWTLSQAA